MKKLVWYKSAIRVLMSITLGLLITVSALGQGLEQSPINIRRQDVTVIPNLPTLNFNYGTTFYLNVVNTGSPDEHATIRADVLPGAGQLQVAGVTYNLLQFHWHVPSEHLIEGEDFPLEMHLVHQAADGTLLVVGIFIEQGQWHAELDKIFANLPPEGGSTTVGRFNLLLQGGNTRTVTFFDLSKLLPSHRESYRYRGSLTTPPFAEGVRWVVLAEPIEMSWQQIFAFKHLFPHENTRHVQPLNGREVLTDVEQDH